MEFTPVEKTENLLQLNALWSNEDIQNQFKKDLKQYAHKVRMKGFRPGKTPPDLVKKMYGQQLMVEMLNKNLVESVQNYLKENGLNIYGSFVMEKTESDFLFDPSNTADFKTSLLLVKEPSVDLEELPFAANLKFVLPTLTESDLDSRVEEVRKNVGTMEESDQPSNSESAVTIGFKELADGSEKAEGLSNNFTYLIASVHNSTLKEDLTGKEKGYEFDFKASDFSDNEYVRKNQILKLETTDETDYSEVLFKGTIEKIENKVSAEINDEFFNKIDPNGEITSIEKLKEVFQFNMDQSYRDNSNILLFDELREFLIGQVTLDLDDDYYKKFFTQNYNVSQHALDFHFDELKEDYKWGWLRDYLEKEVGIFVEKHEVRQAIANEFSQYFGGYRMPDNFMSAQIDKIMADEKMTQKYFDNIYRQKVANALINVYDVPVVHISQDDYNQKVEALNEKFKKANTHEHHDHEHHEHGHETHEAHADLSEEKTHTEND